MIEKSAQKTSCQTAKSKPLVPKCQQGATTTASSSTSFDLFPPIRKTKPKTVRHYRFLGRLHWYYKRLWVETQNLSLTFFSWFPPTVPKYSNPLVVRKSLLRDHKVFGQFRAENNPLFFRMNWIMIRTTGPEAAGNPCLFAPNSYNTSQWND